MTWLLPSNPDARWLALGMLVNSLGGGLYTSVLVLYFVGGVGLQATQVGLTLTVASLAGLMFAPLAGTLLDRFRAVHLGSLFLVLEAAAMLWLAFSGSLWAFGTGALLAAFAGQGSKVSRGVLNAHISSPEERGRVRAQLRSCANLGIALGTAASAVALILLDKGDLRWLLVGNAVTFLLLVVVYQTRLRAIQPAPALQSRNEAEGRRKLGLVTAWADRRYVSVMSMNGLMGVQYAAVHIGVPVLVASRGDVPGWIVPASLAINTLTVVMFQSTLSARVKGIASAGRHMLAAGIALGISSASLALAHLTPNAAWTVALVAVLMVVHSVGEILQVAGSFELSYDLANPAFMGSYQGVYSWTAGVGSALGPSLWSITMAATTVWLAPVVGAAFAAAGMVTLALTRNAEKVTEPIEQ